MHFGHQTHMELQAQRSYGILSGELTKQESWALRTGSGF